MSLLIFAYRKQDIISQKSALNMKLMNLRQKLMDLQSYASSIADGTVSMNDLMGAPASMFARMSIFMMYSHQASMAGAQGNFAQMMQIPGAMPQMQNAQMQQQYQQMMFKNLYNQEREKFSKQEQKILNQQDTKIQQEIAQAETKLKMLDADDEKVRAAEDKEAEKAPKYA
jgi:hypothetical protein